jgi:hypothetical protein
MFLPHCNSHFSNRLFLLLLALLLLAAATTHRRVHPRPHLSFLDAVHTSPNASRPCSP